MPSTGALSAQAHYHEHSVESIWRIIFTDHTAYIKSREAVQRVQLEKAGARLA